MVYWNNDRPILFSPKQKLQKRNSLMNNLYEQYFNDIEVRDYYKELHNIDLIKINERKSLQNNISGHTRKNFLPIQTGA